MRARILDFVQTLRARGGVDVSVAESLDALVAVAAVGVEREAMREALAAALVKHEADRPAFDRLFDEAFPLAGGAEEGRRRRRGRLVRRERRARRGRVDFRRTIRHSMSSGGVPVRPRFRARRPGRPDLVALCDLSGSVAAASELLLGLIAPAADCFRRVHLFAYVDRLCPVSIEHGHVAPGGPLDLHARSDFGRVLAELWEGRRAILTGSALLLVLGDARNNRLPPRADLLRAVAGRVQRIVWLVPEPRARWDTGDSVLRLYAPACEAVVECIDLGAMVRAVRETLQMPARGRVALPLGHP